MTSSMRILPGIVCGASAATIPLHAHLEAAADDDDDLFGKIVDEDPTESGPGRIPSGGIGPAGGDSNTSSAPKPRPLLVAFRATRQEGTPTDKRKARLFRCYHRCRRLLMLPLMRAAITASHGTKARRR